VSKLTGQSWMAVEAGRFQTHIFTVQQTAASWQQVLKADARRWHLRIEFTQQGVGPAMAAPLPFASGTAAYNIIALPIEVKFRDRPAACTGAWGIFCPPGFDVIITEELLVGEA
jgi:hypothetical protein